jgi:hypothetical protein
MFALAACYHDPVVFDLLHAEEALSTTTGTWVGMVTELCIGKSHRRCSGHVGLSASEGGEYAATEGNRGNCTGSESRKARLLRVRGDRGQPRKLHRQRVQESPSPPDALPEGASVMPLLLSLLQWTL